MLKGQKCPEETKRKIGLANKGKSPWSKGKHIGYSWNRGKHISEEHKKKIGEGNRNKKHGIPFKCGELHPNWNGGVTSENKKIKNGFEFKLWREAVFTRDNWTCQRCGIRGGVIHPHHIKNFSQFKELRTSIENGITLCKKCHIEFHKKYGLKNNSIEQIKSFKEIKLLTKQSKLN